MDASSWFQDSVRGIKPPDPFERSQECRVKGRRCNRRDGGTFLSVVLRLCGLHRDWSGSYIACNCAASTCCLTSGISCSDNHTWFYHLPISIKISLTNRACCLQVACNYYFFKLLALANRELNGITIMFKVTE